MMKARFFVTPIILTFACQTVKPPVPPSTQPTTAPITSPTSLTIPSMFPEIRLARISPPRTMNPTYISDQEDERVAGALFSGLTECDPKTLAPRAGLASSWESLEENQRWRFTLREGLYFSNREPLTADDVISSWLRLIDPAMPSRTSFLLDPVLNARSFRNGERLRAIDEITAGEVTFSAGEPLFAVLADLSEVSRRETLYDAPSGGKVVAEVSAGDVVALVDPPEQPDAATKFYKVKLLASGVSLSGAVTEGFLDKRALRPLYGPTLRAIARVHAQTSSFAAVDAPKLDAIQPGEVVAPIPGAFAEQVGALRMMRVRGASGEYLGWVDASALELKTFGAEKVWVQSLDGARSAWVNAKETEPDPSQVGLRKIDTMTVELRLSQPAGYIPALLCKVQLAPTPQDLIKEEGYGWSEPEKLAGSGPFVVEAILENGGVALKPNSLWYKRDLQLSKASFSRFGKTTEEAANQAIQSYRDSKLEALFLSTWTFDQSKHPDLRSRPEYQNTEAWQTFQLRLNTSRDGLKEVKVRQAINAAINREELILTTTSYPSLYSSLRAKRSFSPSFPQYPPPSTPSADATEAARLWKEVSPSQRPKKLQLLSPDWILTRAFATQLQTQVKAALGLELEITYRPWSEVSAYNKRGDFDLVLVSWLGDFSDPATFVGMLSANSAENSIGWRSEPFEEALLAAEKESDAKVRLEKLSQAEAILLQEASLIPLFTESEYTWTRSGLQGLSANPMLIIDWSALRLSQ